MKLGIANTVLLYAIYMLNAKSAVLLMALKVLLSGLLFAGPSAMLYSLAGGVMSLVVMLLIKRIPRAHIIAVSVSGAVMHNVGQLVVVGAVTMWRIA